MTSMLLRKSPPSDDHVQLILTSLQKSLELAVVRVECSGNLTSILSVYSVGRPCTTTLYTTLCLHPLALHCHCMPQTQDLKPIQAHLMKIYSGHLTSSSTMSGYVPGLLSYHGHPPPPGTRKPPHLCSQTKDIKQLQATKKRAKAPADKAAIQQEIARLKQAAAETKAADQSRRAKQRLKQTEAKAVAAGKMPFFPKRAAIKEATMLERYAELEAAKPGGAKAAMRKMQRKRESKAKSAIGKGPRLGV